MKYVGKQSNRLINELFYPLTPTQNRIDNYQKSQFVKIQIIRQSTLAFKYNIKFKSLIPISC